MIDIMLQILYSIEYLPIVVRTSSIISRIAFYLHEKAIPTKYGWNVLQFKLNDELPVLQQHEQIVLHYMDSQLL